MPRMELHIANYTLEKELCEQATSLFLFLATVVPMRCNMMLFCILTDSRFTKACYQFHAVPIYQKFWTSCPVTKRKISIKKF